MQSELVAVLDVNVYIRGCEAVAQGIEITSTWWSIPEIGYAIPVAAALFAGLNAPLTNSIMIGSDEELDEVVMRKLTQPKKAQRPEDCGLGWDLADAKARYLKLITPLHEAGRLYRVHPPAGEAHPPAPAGSAPSPDYEDRRIWGLFEATMGAHPAHDPFLITADRDFAIAAATGCPTLHSGRPAWYVGSPGRFLCLLKKMRTL